MPLPAIYRREDGRMRQPLTNRHCCPSPMKRALCRCESRELGWKPGSRMFADNSGNASLVTPNSETGLWRVKIMWLSHRSLKCAMPTAHNYLADWNPIVFRHRGKWLPAADFGYVKLSIVPLTFNPQSCSAMPFS